ncbi:lateral signaling target protein 2 homolog [Lingula anatina]|uniref:Lateral signaling target protein 2 homolog n=1 Tax=Lingula anatina TaxID=7574 RepID=A0A1S3I6J5_LINAN|nr:lateral signaling target protein 2 homolog [Lingula anatina]|eukprot:XP_013392994.1 lateral signaling target protein 2 homolog [Lingula anatina]
MYSIRRWLYKPKKTDTSLLAQFFYADEELNLVAAELDSFDGRKDPERCTLLVNQLRQCQDRVLGIVQRIMDDAIPLQRSSRDFRVKFPDDVLQESLAGQLWFGAECLAAGSTIMNREVESISMRPLAKALTRTLDQLRGMLRDQCLRNQAIYSDEIKESLITFDRLFADFELSYVSAMVPVKTMKEYDILQEVTVLFCETVDRALKVELLTQDMIDDYDPALMFTIPRLAIVCGLVIYPDGPLNPLQEPKSMSEMYRPFQTLLLKIRELLWTLTSDELFSLEKALCSSEEPGLYRPVEHVFSDSNTSSVEQSPSKGKSGASGKTEKKKSKKEQNTKPEKEEDNDADTESSEENHDSIGALGMTQSPSTQTVIANPSYPPEQTAGGGADSTEGASGEQQQVTGAQNGVTSEHLAPKQSQDLDAADAGTQCSKCSGNAESRRHRRHRRGSGGKGEKHSGSESNRKKRAAKRNQSTQTGIESERERASSGGSNHGAGGSRTTTSRQNSRGSTMSEEMHRVCEQVVGELLSDANRRIVRSSSASQYGAPQFNFHLPVNTSPRTSAESGQSSDADTPRTVIYVGDSIQQMSDISEENSYVNKDDVFEDMDTKSTEMEIVEEQAGRKSESEVPMHTSSSTSSHSKKRSKEQNTNKSENMSKTEVHKNSHSSQQPRKSSKKDSKNQTIDSTNPKPSCPRVQRLQYSDDCSETSSCSTCSTSSEYDNVGSDYDNLMSSTSDTSSYNSESQDDEEIALAIQAAELASRNEARLRFKSSTDLIHRLFVCISGVADQLQTNYASDLRNVLRAVFEVHSSEPLVRVDSAEEVTEDIRSDNSDSLEDRSDGSDGDRDNEEEDVITPTASSPPENSPERNIDERPAQDPPPWVPDELAPHCTSCKVPFSFVRRRHHCRNCGKIFCARCSPNSVPLPHYGHARPVRICNRCFMFQVTPFMVEN